ncbi:uncharacterized protein LOC126381638 [Pectinophora gossypiella]|uniref:uncharacterized protein LOC126381638 n=1 Tax=Pectinophora gossypiella TaxID=13191 RepID=UPI00214E12FD|nr:uncharacterized protein LOC126381638 [Pectinophora gossypiella]
MPTKSVYCSICDLSIKNKAFSSHLRSTLHKNNSSIRESDCIERISSAFRSRIASYRLRSSENSEVGSAVACPPETFLRSLRKNVRQLIDARRDAFDSIKVNFELFAEFSLPQDDRREVKSFNTENIVIHKTYDFNDIFNKVVNLIATKVDEFQERDSGWYFVGNLYLEININKYNPLRASGFIELPQSIKMKRACINIKNNDNFCFLWCIMAALFPTKYNSNRPSSYPHFETTLSTKGMTFPVSLSDVKVFEKNNPRVSVNIYGLKNKKTVVGPLYKSVHKKKKHVNLLLLENGLRSHYCLIKDLSRLIRTQVTKHHGKIFFCDDCMNFFSSENKLDSHACGRVKTVLPEKGSLIQFQHFERMQDMPFVIYADFESLLQPTPDAQNSECTENIQKHVPAAFGYYIVCSYDSSLNKYVSFRGPDCVQNFIENLENDVSWINTILQNQHKMLPLTEQELESFLTSKNCYLCNKLLFEDKVRDHCHLTGRYRGPAHSYCNIQFKLPKFLPVFFHNLSGYDSHLFIRELGEMPGNLNLLAKTKENYISFTKLFSLGNNQYMPIRFVDSFRFLGTSLEKAAENLNKSDFIHLSHFYPLKEQFDLLTRKGIYPYEYMCDWKCYTEVELPPRHQFYSSLTDETISESDYAHTHKVWKTFHLKNLGEYTDLYLKSDVILLTDIFESFRHTCKNNYRLDPAFYVSAPSLSLDAMLLKTGVKLELIDDLEMIRMIQSGIRGGVCLCSTRYAKANNKYLSNYNPTSPNNYLLYIDCNNLYGYAMCSHLPYSDFELIENPKLECLDILNIPDDSEVGYILEVDLVYPDHLHDLHNDIPFCPQKFTPPGSKTCKLIPNLYDKFKYVIHYIHLKTCLKHGLHLKHIHRAIKFKQSPYLRQYIDLNTKLRQKAKSQFEQDFFKLLNNSIFGKTLEDTEKRLNVKLINQWFDNHNKTKKRYTAEQLIARPNYHSSTIFTENLVAIQMKPEIITLDKPIYIGFTVLEISKSHMYDFHYSVLKPFYGSHLKLCYTDTDSFLYSIQTKDVYQDIRQNFQQYFDTSNYKDDNIFGIMKQNKKVPGLFKDELGGQLIVEFVGLRSKLYSIKTEATELKKAKGTKKAVIKKLSFDDYKTVLLDNCLIKKKNLIFKSLKHEIFTQSLKKVALSFNDDKRIVLKDKISTLSWGHESILL